MGRDKIEVVRLGTESARKCTFGKRKMGLTKKVRELSILCEAQVALLAFSPVQKPLLLLGENNNVGAILEKISKTSPTDREKRYQATLKGLKNVCHKQGHEVNTKLLSSNCRERAEEYHQKTKDIDEEITVAKKMLSYFKDPSCIADMKLLDEMEEMLRESLRAVQAEKVRFEGAQDNSSCSEAGPSCASSSLDAANEPVVASLFCSISNQLSASNSFVGENNAPDAQNPSTQIHYSSRGAGFN